jgi:O-methyltransferase
MPRPLSFLWRRAKLLVKMRFARTLYPAPVSNLRPERLYSYLDHLWRRRELDGAIVEVGCFMGGTAEIAWKMLSSTGYTKRYVCIDTFGGFVPAQFDRDRQLGTPETLREGFVMNSRPLVRRVLNLHDAGAVELVEGDIAQVNGRALPDRVIACLSDTDLYEPTRATLEKVYPRLAPGGVILVDDCNEDNPFRGAWRAYAEFVAAEGLPRRLEFGMGVIEAPVR